jgi:hypothetical protein
LNERKPSVEEEGKEMNKDRRTNKVTALLSDEDMKKLKRICDRYDVTMSWVISRLLSFADENQILETREGGEQ